MKKLIILASVLSFNASANTVTSALNGTIDVGTFVSAAPNQHQTQTSTGSLTGRTVLSGTSFAPVVTSSVTGAVSSVSSGTGATFSSFVVNGLPSSAVVQGSVSTTIVNQPLVNAPHTLNIYNH